MTGVLIRKNSHTHTHKERREKRPYEGGDTDGSDAATSQGTFGATRS